MNRQEYKEFKEEQAALDLVRKYLGMFDEFLFDYPIFKDMTDNDDYDDPYPTLIDITYSELLGIIIRKKRSVKNHESSLLDIQSFYHSCSINEYGGLDEYKKISIYK